MQDSQDIKCSHCSLICPDKSIFIEDKYFCCDGCKTVYQLINESDLGDFYRLEDDTSSRKKSEFSKNKYEFLDDDKLKEQLLTFSLDNTSKFVADLPDIHCSACIYLLENLYKLQPGVMESRVNFVKKTASIQFDNSKISLREVAELLEKLGYPPKLTLEKAGKKEQTVDRSLWFKLGAAGFAFGNIMLFSFPEYLDTGDLNLDFRNFLSWISLILTPVILYAGWDYFRSTWAGLRVKHINIDVPISLGIITLVLRSAYEIISGSGTGYIDSLSGLIFFLLIGKVFQKKTYERMNFENDYTSYFPLSIELTKNQKRIPLSNLKVGDRINVKNEEIIPADSILFSESALIDYSFLTGEAEPVSAKKGEKIFAGGKASGKSIDLDVIKKFDKSNFTDLWNKEEFEKKSKNYYADLADNVAKYFTFIILAIGIISFIYWYNTDPKIAFDTFTAVLIIACPCALALSTPFTYGTAMRILGNKGLYLKSEKIIEALSNIKEIIFDKTGTLTSSSEIQIFDNDMDENESELVGIVAGNSNHPISKTIAKHFESEKQIVLDTFMELAGKGIEGNIGDTKIKIGSSEWISNSSEKLTLIEVNGEVKAKLRTENNWRDGIKDTLENLSDYKLSVISGDNQESGKKIYEIMPKNSDANFEMSPEQKYDFIKKGNPSSKLMIGDGLNDAGALASSGIGFAVADDTSGFTPSSDGIIEGKKLNQLDKIMQFSKSSVNTVIVAFIISFLYNIVGLSFAVSGNLSPIAAAILMPLSSITIVLFTTLTTIWKSKRIFG